MLERMTDLFDGILPVSKLDEIADNYESYKDTPLIHLGVDSLATMGIVLRILNLFNIEIDFETFDINNVETLAKIEIFIKRN